MPLASGSRSGCGAFETGRCCEGIDVDGYADVGVDMDVEALDLSWDFVAEAVEAVSLVPDV